MEKEYHVLWICSQTYSGSSKTTTEGTLLVGLAIGKLTEKATMELGGYDGAGLLVDIQESLVCMRSWENRTSMGIASFQSSRPSSPCGRPNSRYAEWLCIGWLFIFARILTLRLPSLWKQAYSGDRFHKGFFSQNIALK